MPTPGRVVHRGGFLISFNETSANENSPWGLRREGGNPCRFVRKYTERKRERFLSDDEFRRLGEVLNEMEAAGSVSAYAAAAIRLLMLTGCRRNEIVTLRWEDVDLEAGELRLPDGKTGARLVPLSPVAARVLDVGLVWGDGRSRTSIILLLGQDLPPGSRHLDLTRPVSGRHHRTWSLLPKWTIFKISWIK